MSEPIDLMDEITEMLVKAQTATREAVATMRLARERIENYEAALKEFNVRIMNQVAANHTKTGQATVTATEVRVILRNCLDLYGVPL